MGTWLLVHALLGVKLFRQLRGVGWQQVVLACKFKGCLCILHPGLRLIDSRLLMVRGTVAAQSQGSTPDDLIILFFSGLLAPYTPSGKLSAATQIY